MKNLTLYSILLLALACSHSKVTETKSSQLYLYEFPVKKYSKLIEGGFSGLHFEKLNEKNELIFWTHTDRGPNAESFQDESGVTSRPFVRPKFNPHIVKFALNPETKQIRYLDEISLKLPDGTPLTGLPNYTSAKGRTGDEAPVTIKKEKLAYDPLGIDPEGICLKDQNIWMVEEYGPSILKFDLEGKLITRFVPKNYYSMKDAKLIEKKYGKKFIQDILPREILTRKLNRGFEGVACGQDKIYATLQSPLPGQGQNVLILEFDLKKNRISNQFKYPLDAANVEKIGDLFFQVNKLFIIEQNSEIGPDSFHKIFAIDMNKAKTKKPLEKKLVVDLVKLGFDFTDKIEGLSVLPNGDIYVVNDNDFGLTGSISTERNEADVDSNRKSVLALIKP